MTYETRAYDNEWGDPVVVIVVEGTHDVSRIVHLLSRGLCEHVSLSQKLLKQVRRHNGGRAALALLTAHGGPDFLNDGQDVERPAVEITAEMVQLAFREYAGRDVLRVAFETAGFTVAADGGEPR